MASAASYAPTGFSYYVWWFPGSPVRVHLSLDVVRRLGGQLQTAPAQGFLFGKTADGATEILDFQSSPGPIPESVAALAEDGGKPLLVGWYRTGNSLALNDGDRALARTFFAQPYQVLLAIQPAEVGPPTASFFFHDADGKMAEYSLMEFPFEPSLLAGEERDRLRRSQEAAARRSAALQPADSAEPPRNAPRLRIVPALLCILAILGALAGGARWWAARLAVRSTPASAAAGSAAQPLSVLVMGLRAKRQNGDVEIAWNHDSPVIAAAISGVLSIQDGASRRDIALDGGQIRSSGVLYSPSSDNVSIQLAVTTPLSTVTESFLLLLPENRLPKPPVPGEPKAAVIRPVLLKPFTPPVAAAANAPEPTTPALPLVSLQPGAAADPVSVSKLMTQPSLPAAPRPGGPAGNAAPAPAVYQPAEPRNRFVPQIPATLMSTVALPTTIQVRVFIDRNGRVTRAEGVPHRGVNSMLMDRLVAASHSWTFTPARRGDEPIASEFVLEFRFGR